MGCCCVFGFWPNLMVFSPLVPDFDFLSLHLMLTFQLYLIIIHTCLGVRGARVMVLPSFTMIYLF